MANYPNDQSNPAGAIPVYITKGGGGGGGGPSGSPAGAYQQISAATLAAATPLMVPAGATSALIQAENGDVRWRDDGTVPTGAVGMLLLGGSAATTFVGDLSAVKFILSSATPAAILNVSYYK